jgi:hypothetical protein
MDLAPHIESLRNLNVSQTDAIDIKLFPNGAPYKALTLLSVFDLLRMNEIRANHIMHVGALENRYETYKVLLQTKLPSPLAMPYGALHNEAFWKLTMVDGISYESVRREIRSQKKLAEYVLFAQFEITFWDTLQFDEIRGVYRQALLDSYFAKYLHVRLWNFALR